MMHKNYYEILGIKVTASSREIRKAFHGLAQRYHPDSTNAPDAKDRFLQIVEAYDTLSDKDLRSKYDIQHGIMVNMKVAAAQPEHKDENAEMFKRLRDKVDEDTESDNSKWQRFGKIYPANDKDHPTIGQRFFNWFLGTGNKDKTEAEQAPAVDIPRTQKLTISALEVLNGTTRELVIGSGNKQKKIKVVVPPYTQPGTILRTVLENRQKVQTQIFVDDHKFLSFDRANIELKLPITLGESIRGAQVEISLVGQTIKLNIPALTIANQAKLRIAGRGLKNEKGSPGDLIIIPTIIAPLQDNTNVLTQIALAADQLYIGSVRKDLEEALKS
ncbi:MAG: J domain-containing protein [Deltaproteobacteria bacterium]|nr:J domain-containing protein [Deltaproteobacteria bacterium]